MSRIIPLFLIPFSVFAAAPTNFAGVVERIVGIVGTAIPVLMGIAVLFFFWGLARFIFGSGSGNEKVIKEGQSLMLWGMIALFVTFSIWGLARLTSNFFFKDTNTTTPPVPTLPAIGALGS